MESVFESGEGGIGEGGRGVEFEPAHRQTIGKKFLEGFADGGEIAAAGNAKRSGGVALGSEIEVDELALFPVGRDLENGGAAEAAMSEEHFFAEGIIIGGSDDLGGDAGEFGVAAVIGAIEDEGNEGGTRGNDVMAELAGEVVTEGGGSHLGDGEAAGGDDEDGSAKFGGIGAKEEFGGAPDFGDACVDEDLDVGGATSGFEQVDDFGGGIVAEELAESFFVPGDAMFSDESKKIIGRETGEGGFGKVGIGGEEIFRCCVNVGEIAAAAAGDEDFFADAVGMFEDGDAAAAFAGFDGAEEAGGAGAQDQNVEGMGQGCLTGEWWRHYVRGNFRAEAVRGEGLSSGVVWLAVRLGRQTLRERPKRGD